MNQASHAGFGSIPVPNRVWQPRSVRSDLGRAAHSARFLVVLLSLVTTVLAHNAVFLLAYGSGDLAALVATGHDSRWADAVTGILAAASILTLAGGLGLVRLALIARHAGSIGRRPSRSDLEAVEGAIAWLWARIATVSVVLFVIQENVERASAGIPLPGLGVLGSTDALPLPIFLGISLLAAVVGALFRWSRAALLARIASAAAPHPFPHPGSPACILIADVRSDASPIARNLAGRAPPLPAPV